MGPGEVKSADPAPPADQDPAPPADQEQPERMVLGLLAAPGVAYDLAQQLAQELPGLLKNRFPDIDWEVAVEVDSLAGAAGLGADLVQVARRRMLAEGWDQVVVLTDLPLHVGRRVVTAQASISLGVGVISVPALGAVAMESRVQEALLRLLDGLLGERMKGRRRSGRDLRGRFRRRVRLKALTSPMGQAYRPDDRTLRFTTATVRGNLRLLLGMVRANRPWRLVSGLSRALVGALGTAAFGITSPGIWMLANGMGWPRLLALSLGSLLVICVTIIVVHGLWEQSPEPQVRDRVVLINLATALTIALGMLSHYLLLLVINAIGATALIAPAVFQAQLHHPVGVWDYVKLAWLVSSLATIGGALGAAIESDAAVREAAYGYRPD
jgi:uncharacterized membrane protein